MKPLIWTRSLILILCYFLYSTGIAGQEKLNNEVSWSEKKFSIGLSGGLANYTTSILTPGFEFPVISYRPLPNLQITYDGVLTYYSSFLAGYVYPWNRWQFYVQGGLKFLWSLSGSSPGDIFLGPEVQAGAEYLLLKWLSIGAKLSGSYMFDASSSGMGISPSGGAFPANHLQGAFLVTVNFVF